MKTSSSKLQAPEKLQAPNSKKSSLTISKVRSIKSIPASLGIVLGLHPGSLWACAACYGQSDSPMANGMNWGIFSLLVVVVGVLGSIAAFFVFLARRTAANPNPQPARTDYPSPVTTH